MKYSENIVNITEENTSLQINHYNEKQENSVV